MLEQIGNMWDIRADSYCITTNEIVKGNGCAVMGAGIALSAVKRYPDCSRALADFIKKNGHKVGIFYNSNDLICLVSFPTKYHFIDPSDIKLIEKSAKELMELIKEKDWDKVILPRPGCANGGLNWDDVKMVIEPILDDRVIIISL